MQAAGGRKTPAEMQALRDRVAHLRALQAQVLAGKLSANEALQAIPRAEVRAAPLCHPGPTAPPSCTALPPPTTRAEHC